MINDSKLNDLEPYLPSSSEKKQAVMMYMVVGLVLSMGKLEVSPYTHHHLKQSLGWLVFLVLIIFLDLGLVVLGLVFSFFMWIAMLITIPTLVIGAMGIHQATKGKYIWESEAINKFFMVFSGIGNWILNLFDSNHYQIIDGERYRSEDQFYTKKKNDENIKSDNGESVDSTNNNSNNTNSTELDLGIQNHEINNEVVDVKKLDNNQEIPINNQDIGIDLSNHEINDSHDFELDL